MGNGCEVKFYAYDILLRAKIVNTPNMHKKKLGLIILIHTHVKSNKNNIAFKIVRIDFKFKTLVYGYTQL